MTVVALERRMGTEAIEEDALRRRLARVWSQRAGLYGVLADVRHTTIGLRMIVTAFVFFALGGALALAMRLQLATPDARILGPDEYDQVFTVHGSTMMFLFAVPIVQAIGVYLVPLMIGARNLAFPRLAAYSYWTYLAGGALLYVAFLGQTGPDAGWFAYTPLSGPAFSPGKRVDVWAQMITFTELSALSTAVNVIVTVFKHRAPGMSLDRIPLFVWAQLVMSFMVVFAMPAVMLASGCLALDRLVGTHFFNPAEGGDALLWQHLFWFFGHPEVYIIFVPALGVVSSIVTTFSRRKIVGYTAMVLSLVATAMLGFGLWVHHMFATGLPQLGESFFTAASMMIAIPSGIQIFCWIATLFGGKPRLQPPLLFVLGFFGVFVLGGLTGVMLASVPIDLQVHDTFFVVAHLHYVLIGGMLFPITGAIYYWFPKVTGRMLNETAGRWNAALLFVGFNVTFFPMHNLGLLGMPRRVYTYAESTGWGPLNMVATVGAFVILASFLLLLGNMIVSARRGLPAGDDPWGADTLEWSTSSPPPDWGFAVVRGVEGRHALWERTPRAAVVTGLGDDEMLVTRLVDAAPDHRVRAAGPSIWPLFAAIGTTVTWTVAMFTPWGVPIGGVLVGLALLGWFWPKGRPGELAAEQP